MGKNETIDGFPAYMTQDMLEDVVEDIADGLVRPPTTPFCDLLLELGAGAGLKDVEKEHARRLVAGEKYSRYAECVDGYLDGNLVSRTLQ